MYLEKTTYPWSLKMGHRELEIVARALKIVSNDHDDEMGAGGADTAFHLHENITRVMSEKAEKERDYRERRERERDSEEQPGREPVRREATVSRLTFSKSN